MAEVRGAQRVDHLDGVRALAIGCVLGVHWVGQYTPIGRGGPIGVDLFFVLSGFIITTILWSWKGEGSLGGQVGEFLKRRFRRLYPALIGLCLLTRRSDCCCPTRRSPTSTWSSAAVWRWSS